MCKSRHLYIKYVLDRNFNFWKLYFFWKGTKLVIWYNTFQTLVHAERIYTNNSGTHYTIIIRFKKNAYSPHMLVNFRLRMAGPCMPWLSSHGFGLNLNHLNRTRHNYNTKSEKFLDSLLLERLICHRSDDFDDSEFSEPTYIYATR